IRVKDSLSKGPPHLTKTKAATYELKWIKDLILELWSIVVVNYDQNAYFRTSYGVPNAKASTDMQFKRKRLMRTDELYKFSDGALNDVWTALHDITTRLRMDYLPMRRWSNLDKKRAWVMLQDIDNQLYQMRLMWNLEKFVGERPYGEDLRCWNRPYDLSYAVLIF
nr:hypothetical protein [Tanacetum cinerariifolium]